MQEILILLIHKQYKLLFLHFSFTHYEQFSMFFDRTLIKKLNEYGHILATYSKEKLQPHSVWKDSAALNDYSLASFTRECTCVQLYMAFISFSYPQRMHLVARRTLHSHSSRAAQMKTPELLSCTASATLSINELFCRFLIYDANFTHIVSCITLHTSVTLRSRSTCANTYTRARRGLYAGCVSVQCSCEAYMFILSCLSICALRWAGRIGSTKWDGLNQRGAPGRLTGWCPRSATFCISHKMS